MDKNQIIQIIAENNKLGYDEIKKQALNAGVPEAAFEEAWAESEHMKKNTLKSRLMKDKKFLFIALLVYSIGLPLITFIVRHQMSYAARDIIWIVFTITIITLLIISLFKDKKKFKGVIFLVFLILVFNGYLTNALINFLELLHTPVEYIKYAITVVSSPLRLLPQTLLMSDVSFALKYYIYSIPIVYLIFYIIIQVGLHNIDIIKNKHNESDLKFAKRTIYLFILNLSLFFIGLVCGFLSGHMTGVKIIILTLLINSILCLTDFILSIVAEIRYKKFGWLIIGNIIFGIAIGGMYIFAYAAAIGD